MNIVLNDVTLRLIAVDINGNEHPRLMTEVEKQNFWNGAYGPPILYTIENGFIEVMSRELSQKESRKIIGEVLDISAKHGLKLIPPASEGN